MEGDMTGGPAFPVPGLHVPDALSVMPKEGMTLRDYFAAKIAAAMMTATSADRDYPNIDYQRDAGGPTAAERVATIAYRMADAMLAEREKEQA